MTEKDFRAIALDLPDTEEREHMQHPDFRVRGKIFASLGSPKPGWGMLKLTPEQQAEAMRDHPDLYLPAAGAWGTGGATHVLLKGIGKRDLRRMLLLAWRNVAPKALVNELGPER